MHNYILGLHVSHNSSACLFKDGELIFAVQEERLTRVKQFEGFPRHSIRFVLEQASISPNDVKHIAIAGVHQHMENPIHVYLKDASTPKPLTSFFGRASASIKGRIKVASLDETIYSKSNYQSYITDEISRLGFNLKTSRLSYHDHHLCHATSAYYPSGYDKALVITQDGRGDFLSGSIWEASGDTLKLLASQGSDSSFAQLYAGVTMYLGFTPLKHEGKITGLAAFGSDSELKDKIIGLFTVAKNGSIIRNNKHQELIELDGLLDSREHKLINASPNSYKEFVKFGFLFQKWLKKHAAGMSREDVAYAIQDATEKVIVSSVLNMLKSNDIVTPINVCLAGGLFANVKVNQRVRECSPLVKNVFVQPAMGDEGLAIGAALIIMNELKMKCKPFTNMYFGNNYSDDEIEKELIQWKPDFTYQKYKEVEVEIANQLNKGKVVGRFNGSMEFGPRALGNRSILIHPTNKDMNDIVNKRLKRTEFMPFAPSVLDFRCKDYFKNYDENHLTADWMTITYDVYEEKVESIAAVVHIDNTARPQVVKSSTNPSYYKILEEFNKLSGIGCFVNTSFNMHEEPIIATPYDAMRAFEQGSVDCLAIGNFIVWPSNNG